MGPWEASWRKAVSDGTDIPGRGPKVQVWGPRLLSCSGLHSTHRPASSSSSPRWCPTLTDFFAVSTGAAGKGGHIHLYNMSYSSTSPSILQVSTNRLHYVRDFDFVAEKNMPRMAAAVGRELIIFFAGRTSQDP